MGLVQPPYKCRKQAMTIAFFEAGSPRDIALAVCISVVRRNCLLSAYFQSQKNINIRSLQYRNCSETTTCQAHLNGQTDKVALNPHRMKPFLLRPNKSAQLLEIIVALAKLTVSSSSSDVNTDIWINQIKHVKKR